MKTGDFVVCPACGTRNKTSWEYCVRCGESLEGAATSAPARPPAAPVQESDGAWKTWAGTVALIAVAVGGFLYIRQANATSPVAERSPLTIPTLPKQPVEPAKAPPQAGPGAKDFGEGARLLRAKRFADAIPLLQNAVSAEPENGLFLSTLGEALLENGQPEEAIAQFQAAAAASDAYRVPLARALEKAGRTTEALREMEAAAGNAASEDAREELGHMYYRAGQYDKALPLLASVAERRPGDALTLQEVAYAAGKAGDSKKEEEIYKKILARRPDATVARAQLAESLSRQGRGEEAMATLREGIEQNPGSAVLRGAEGALLDRQGRVPEAIASYKEALRLAGETEQGRKIAARIAELQKTQGAGAESGTP
jgi:tetratricopeptide (TPR) repeat protein